MLKPGWWPLNIDGTTIYWPLSFQLFLETGLKVKGQNENLAVLFGITEFVSYIKYFLDLDLFRLISNHIFFFGEKSFLYLNWNSPLYLPCSIFKYFLKQHFDRRKRKTFLLTEALKSLIHSLPRLHIYVGHCYKPFPLKTAPLLVHTSLIFLC